jgi:flagellin
MGTNAARNVNRTYNTLFKTAEKLSSGLRINKASDDPAGLVISEQLRAKIASLNQEIENTTFAISKYQTADSVMGELRSTLQRVRGDAVAAANSGFLDPSGQAALNTSARHAIESYNSIIQNAEFNSQNLLDGSEGSLAGLSQLEGIDLSSAEKAEEAIGKIDTVMAELDEAQVEIGATQKNELEARRSNLEVTVQNLISAESALRDADIPLEISRFASSQIQLRAGLSILAHANLNHKLAFTILGS